MVQKTLLILFSIGIIALFNCGPTKASLNSKEKYPTIYKTNSVNLYLSYLGHEFFTLSPTETFALGYKVIQINLNRWCIIKGGKPYYFYKDKYGDSIYKELIFYSADSIKPKYVADMVDNEDRYVVCILPNGRELYRYKQYTLDKHCSNLREDSCWYNIGTLIIHSPEKEIYFWNGLNFPSTLEKIAENTVCNGGYCSGIWYISDFSYLSGVDFIRPYIYCKYHLGGVLFKDNNKWVNWFKEYILKRKIGYDWDKNFIYLLGYYVCYDGKKSFEASATFYNHYTIRNDISLKVYFKENPNLKLKEIR